MEVQELLLKEWITEHTKGIIHRLTQVWCVFLHVGPFCHGGKWGKPLSVPGGWQGEWLEPNTLAHSIWGVHEAKGTSRPWICPIAKSNHYSECRESSSPHSHKCKSLVSRRAEESVESSRKYSIGNRVNNIVIAMLAARWVLGISGETLCKIYDCLTTMLYAETITN